MPKTFLADNLQSLSRIRHGFYTAEWGDCGLRDTNDVTDNRRAVAGHLGVVGENLLSCYQIHSPDVVTVTAPWAVPDRPKADAMVTNIPGIALGILTADCVPVLFVDEKAGVIGAAHAGWRGAISGVLHNTVMAMKKLGARASHIHAAIGPCIWQNSYEVGPEFPAPFLAEDPENERLFRPSFKSGHTMFNLPAYVEKQLGALDLAGYSPSPADTCADEPQFFSYRRSTLRGEERAGSLISAVVLTV